VFHQWFLLPWVCAERTGAAPLRIARIGGFPTHRQMRPTRRASAASNTGCMILVGMLASIYESVKGYKIHRGRRRTQGALVVWGFAQLSDGD
jgi:hypothetical protein